MPPRAQGASLSGTPNRRTLLRARIEASPVSCSDRERVVDHRASRQTAADTVAIGLFEGEDAPAGAPEQVGELLSSGEARASFKSLGLTHAEGKRWLTVGLGAREDFTPERARVAAAVARERAREMSTKVLCWQAPALSRTSSLQLVQGTGLADYSFDSHKSSPKGLQTGTPREGGQAGKEGSDAKPKHLEGLILAGDGDLAAVVGDAQIVSEAVNEARDLQNRPANDLTPTALAEHARRLGEEIEHLSVEVEGRDGMLSRKMGAFAAVAQGSEQEPALITMRYEPPGRLRPAAGLRGQGRHIRQRRHLAEARGEDGRDEVRHVRWGGGDLGDGRDRSDRPSGADRGRGGRHREPAERSLGQARGHRDGVQRQDDRGQQHRRRGPARAGRLPLPRDLAWRRAGRGPGDADRRGDHRARLDLCRA